MMAKDGRPPTGQGLGWEELPNVQCCSNLAQAFSSFYPREQRGA